MDLSIIIPGCNEWPMNAFTIQSIRDCIGDKLDYEILYIENCDYKLENLQTIADVKTHVIPQGIDKVPGTDEPFWGAFSDKQKLAVLRFIALWQTGTQGLGGIPHVRHLCHNDTLSQEFF